MEKLQIEYLLNKIEIWLYVLHGYIPTEQYEIQSLIDDFFCELKDKLEKLNINKEL